MTLEPPDPSSAAWLLIVSGFIKRWSELVEEELQRDLQRFSSLDKFDRIYLVAYWKSVLDRTTSPNKMTVPFTSIDEFKTATRFIEEHYGFSFETTPDKPRLAADVSQRLVTLKERVAKEFEDGILNTIAENNITSPIEHIFLMEWRHARIEERFRLQLRPQQVIHTDSGPFTLDYCITTANEPTARFSIAIELDGHEFHEKSAEQVRNDKRRERAIIRAGVPNGLVVLRFSGSEIFRNCKACIDEIVDYIEQRSIS